MENKKCSKCRWFKVVDIRGPVLLTMCSIVEVGEPIYRDEEQTCNKWESKMNKKTYVSHDHGEMDYDSEKRAEQEAEHAEQKRIALENGELALKRGLEIKRLKAEVATLKKRLGKYLGAELIRAALGGDKETVKRLIDEGADLDESDENGWTALMEAALKGNTEIVRLLIKVGVDVNARDSDGNTALMLAKWKGHADIVKILKRAGAK